MNRAAFFAFAMAAAAGCGPKSFDSLCDNSPTEPDACKQACDPTPGAVTTCPGGFHCTPDGMCDAVCVPGSSTCGSGYVCTDDGQCVDDGSGSNVPDLPDADCPDVSFMATQVTPSIQLVLDRSGSMNTNFGGGLNRYQAMRDAIVGTAGVVTQLEDKAYFGSELYTDGGVSCPNLAVVPRALNNAAAIRTSIDSFDPRNGNNTPTPLAIDAAVSSFAASPPPAASPPVIVLATDGLPNTCGDPGTDTSNQSVAAAAASFAAGIPVYVLAINQSSQHFQNLANAGQGWQAGQPNVPYYVANNPQELSAAFQQVVNGVVSCDLAISGSIDESQAADGHVTLNGMTLVYGTDWELKDSMTIRLLGQACTDLKASAAPAVQATFPCGSIIGKQSH